MVFGIVKLYVISIIIVAKGSFYCPTAFWTSEVFCSVLLKYYTSKGLLATNKARQ